MPRFTAAEYANGARLDTLGHFSVALGVSFIEANAGVFRKVNTNPTAASLTLEDNGAETRQEISTQFSGFATFQHGLTVMGSNTGGLTGYMLSRTGTTGLRLTRYVAGTGTTVINSIPTDGDPVVKLRAEIVSGNPVLTVLLDGVVASTFTDTSGSKLTTGRKGMGTVTLSAFSPYGGPFIETNYADAATAFTVEGPEASNVGLHSGHFTVEPNGLPDAGTVVTLSDGGAGGTFTPSTLTFNNEVAQTFTYTGASIDTVSISMTNDGGYDNPEPLTCAVVAVPIFPAGMIGPGAGWNGTAGTGGPIAVDPPRTMAKPALRIATPPKQAFTSDLALYIKAGAKGGIKKVFVRCEGLQVEVTTETLVTSTDRWGRTHKNVRYVVTLDHSAFPFDGFFEVQIGAEANDGTMQVRWMSPLRFYRASTPFSHHVQVAPSVPVSEGVSYQTLAAALNHIATQSGVTHAGIEIIEDGDYQLGSPNSFGVPTWTKIFADASMVDATIVGSSVASGVAKAAINCGHSNVAFSGVAFDAEWLGVFDITAQKDIWWDQCEFYSSDGWDALRDGTVNMGAFPQVSLDGTRVSGWSTECYMHDWAGSQANISLVRNPDWTDCPSDVVTNVACVDGGVYRQVQTGRLRDNTPALNVVYTGSGVPSGLISRATVGTAYTTQIQLLVDGVAVSGGTFAISATPNVGNHMPSDLALLIDALANFGCTVPEGGDIKALIYAISGAAGYATSQTITFTDGEATIYTSMDIHQDWWQGHRGGSLVPIENIIIDACSLIYAFKMQGILTGDTPINDMFIRNTTIDTTLEPNGAPLTQFNREKSHLVVENCAWTQQAVVASNTGDFDDYCSFYGTVFSKLDLGGAAYTFEIDHCHFMTGTVPAWATNPSTGGGRASLWTDMDSLEPLGLLVSNSAPPRSKYDAFGNMRHLTASALGAVAAPMEYAEGPIVLGPMVVGVPAGAQHSFSLTINPA